eukprot:11081590-Alexandrium_andersonii.AAC.1
MVLSSVPRALALMSLIALGPTRKAPPAPCAGGAFREGPGGAVAPRRGGRRKPLKAAEKR